MKKYINRSALLFLGTMATMIIITWSCEKSLETWSTPESVYFNVRKKATATTESVEIYHITRYTFNFVPESVEEKELLIRVTVQGKSSPMDRLVAYELTDSTTAVYDEDFRFGNPILVIPADSIHGYISLRLNRSESLKYAQKRVSIRLVENEYFRLNYQYEKYGNRDTTTSLVEHHVFFEEMMNNWPEPESLRNLMLSVWGKFSWDKLHFICEVMKIEAKELINSDYMTVGRIIYISNRVQKELDIRLANGDPVMDGDGLMTLK